MAVLYLVNFTLPMFYIAFLRDKINPTKYVHYQRDVVAMM